MQNSILSVFLLKWWKNPTSRFESRPLFRVAQKVFKKYVELNISFPRYPNSSWGLWCFRWPSMAVLTGRPSPNQWIFHGECYEYDEYVEKKGHINVSQGFYKRWYWKEGSRYRISHLTRKFLQMVGGALGFIPFKFKNKSRLGITRPKERYIYTWPKVNE